MATQHLHGLRMNKIAKTYYKRRKRTRWAFFFGVFGSTLFSVALVVGSIFLPSLHIVSEVSLSPSDAGFSTSIPQDPTTSTAIDMRATLPSGTVCRNVPEGRLHVRIAPGEGNAEAGHLTEGEVVTISTTPTQTTPDGGRWIELLSPLSGWVNANYICTLRTPSTLKNILKSTGSSTMQANEGVSANASTPSSNTSTGETQK